MINAYHALRREIHRKSLVLATLAARTIITLPIAATLHRELTTAAFRERGYSAMGGEWILIIGLSAVVWVLTGYIAQVLLLGQKK